MERLLHYVWRHKIFPLEPLFTTDRQQVEVIDPGLPNLNAGPDFFNAKLKVDGTLWAGNVEIHEAASDWMRHGHGNDPAYDSVILHVVGKADCTVVRSDGHPIPQLQLPCPDEVRHRYATLQDSEFYPPCYTVVSDLPVLTVHSWLSALQMERFEQKAATVSERLKKQNGNWADVLFITLARNFGFGVNGDAFQAWAESLPLRAVDKHRDNLLQVEAFFFGHAGLLEDELPDADGYYMALQREYRYLCRKFSLSALISSSRWKLLRMRPGNFPHVRLAQLAALYHSQEALFSRLMEAETPDAAKELFKVKTSAYWDTHFSFRKCSPTAGKQLGEGALNLLLINTVVPLLYAYGLHKGDDRLCTRATGFLESVKAENNYVTRMWGNIGLPVHTAADSQALLQLQKMYCERKDCLHCRFGYEFLKKR